MASAKKSSAAYGTKSCQGGGSPPPSDPPPPSSAPMHGWHGEGLPPPIEQAPTPPVLNKLLHVGEPPPPKVPTAILFRPLWHPTPPLKRKMHSSVDPT